MGELSQLVGLGPTSERQLNEIGVTTRSDLETMGVVNAFIKLKRETSADPSLNFLFALFGALRGEYWASISKEDKEKMLFEAEGFKTLESILKDEGIEIEL